MSQKKTLIYIKISTDSNRISFPYPMLFQEKNTDYICFTNNPNLQSNYWAVVYVEDFDSKIIEKSLESYQKVFEIQPNQIIVDAVFSDGEINENAVITIPSWDEIKEVSFDRNRLVPTSDVAGNYLFERNPVYTGGKYNGRELLLTIGVPVSNQIDTIERCLSKIVPLLENLDAELLVIDTGSTDGTIEVCKAYGARVIEEAWCDNMSYIRNKGIHEALGEWYLSLDDDEWFEDVSDILSFFQSGNYQDYDGATYIQRNYNASSGQTYSDNHTLRMARITPELHFEGRIHDAMMAPKEAKICALSSYAHHFGFVKDDRQKAKKKYLRNVPYLLYDLYEYPNNLRYNYQLAKELNAVEEYEQAIAFFFRGMAIEKEFPDAYWGKNHAIHLLATLYNASDDRIFRLAKTFCEEYSFTPAERAFVSYILVDLGFEVSHSAEEVLDNYSEYLKFREVFEKAPEESLRLSTVGLEVCTNSCYFTDMQMVAFCIYCREKCFEKALEVLDQVQLETMTEHIEDFCQCFWMVPEAIAGLLLEKMGSILIGLWFDKLVNAFMAYSEEGIMDFDRFSKMLQYCSVQRIEQYFINNGNSIDEAICRQLCDALLSLRIKEQSVQELYFYSHLYKLQYRREVEEPKHIGYFCQYVSLLGAFVEMYYNPSALENDCYVIAGDVKAAYYLSLAIEEPTLNQSAVQNMRQALAIFPGFRREIQILLKELKG